MIKKSIYAISICFILTFDFLCIEYFLYELLIKKSNFFYLAFPSFLLILILSIKSLNKFNWYKKYINDIIVLGAVFIGLGLLKLLV